ncbi:MAG: thioesterase family protein [Bacteroidota bacterium]
MYRSETQLRVRYSETDQMGFVYYGHYAAYFEVARVESLRHLGLRYRDLEADGILMPVVDYTIRYHRPARYDEQLKIVTEIPELPRARIRFEYRTYNEDAVLINEASTTLFFMNSARNRPCAAPAGLLERLQPYFPAEG